MKKNERIRLLIGLILNLIVFGLAVYCFIGFIKSTLNSENNRFRFFTNITTTYIVVSALINAIFLGISVIKGELKMPKVVSIIKFVGLTMAMLTFFAVLFVIAPITSFQENYSGRKIFTHLILPIAVIVSYLFFEENHLFEWRYSLFGLIPFAIYSVVYIINVVFLSTWPDIYRINKQGLWYLFVLVYYVADFGFAQGVYFLKKLVIAKVFKTE